MLFTKKSDDDDVKTIDEVLSTKDFATLKIEFKSCDLEIKAVDHFEVHYHGAEYRKPTVENDHAVTTVKEPDVKSKEISRWEKGFFKIEVNRTSQSKVTITVPKGTVLDELDVSLMSGDTSLNQLEVSEFNYESMSGDLTVKTVKIGSMDISGTSGDMSFSEVKVDEGEIDLTSGDFEMGDSRITKKLQIDTVSGDNLIKHTQVARCKLSTVSGSNLINGHKNKEGQIGVQDGSILKMTTVSGDNRIEVEQII